MQTFFPQNAKFSNREKNSRSCQSEQKKTFSLTFKPPTLCVGGDIDENVLNQKPTKYLKIKSTIQKYLHFKNIHFFKYPFFKNIQILLFHFFDNWQIIYFAGDPENTDFSSPKIGSFKSVRSCVLWNRALGLLESRSTIEQFIRSQRQSHIKDRGLRIQRSWYQKDRDKERSWLERSPKLIRILNSKKWFFIAKITKPEIGFGCKSTFSGKTCAYRWNRMPVDEIWSA